MKRLVLTLIGVVALIYAVSPVDALSVPIDDALVVIGYLAAAISR